ILQPANHDGIEQVLPLDRHAATEPERVEDFQQCREAIGVPVVRGGGKKEPMLEAWRQVTSRTSELGVDRILRTARRRDVVRLVQNQQRARPELAKPVAQWGGVRFINQESIRDEETIACRPGVYLVTTLAADACEEFAIDNRERE